MAHQQSKTAKRNKTQNKTRSVESEVFSDSKARNLMANQSKLTPKSITKKTPKAVVKKQQAKIRLYGSKSGKEYREDQLDIPTLNKAVLPGIMAKKGKKGKKFVGDDDSLTMNRLVKSINDKYDQLNESKLEKSRRLEELRDLKRQELERKDQMKKDKLEGKKDELKSKASLARLSRRKNAKARRSDDDDLKSESSGRKSVSFA
jgi:60S ribosomal subunit assembly/export protein LOC1